jgi:vacuolar-type H+-ATPase subunit H
MASYKKFGWIEFLTGFAAGSAVTLFLSKKNIRADIENIQRKAEEMKNQLINKAKNISSEAADRSQRFITSCRRFADGKYTGTLESLEKEYSSVKHAINTAIKNYRKASKNINGNSYNGDDLYIDFDDETLPKFVGMGRRKK